MITTQVSARDLNRAFSATTMPSIKAAGQYQASPEYIALKLFLHVLTQGMTETLFKAWEPLLQSRHDSYVKKNIENDVAALICAVLIQNPSKGAEPQITVENVKFGKITFIEKTFNGTSHVIPIWNGRTLDPIEGTIQDFKTRLKHMPGVNLGAQHLEGGDLDGANLEKANLEDGFLKGVNLQNGKLKNAILRRTRLEQSNLKNADLSKANLASADLQEANLQDAYMRGAVLSGANLHRAKLINTKLPEANLVSAVLSEANLQDANLQGANLHNATLVGATLDKTDFKNACLCRANMRGLNLTTTQLNGADLSWADLSCANMRGLNLTTTQLNGADLLWADLRGAKLQGLVLKDVNLVRTKFDESTDLTGTQIELRLPKGNWTEEGLDLLLNHLNNPSGSLLSTINSISGQPNLQLNLMHQIIDSLEGVDISMVSNAFLDVILSNKNYCKDAKILKFAEKLLYSKINAANSSRLVVANSAELELLLAIVERNIEEAPKETEQGKFMLENNGFFVQLMTLCANHSDIEIKEKAEQLYTTYLNLEPLKIYNTKFLKGVNLIEDGLKDITSEELAFVFVTKNTSTNNYDGLILSQQNIQAMLDNSQEHDWHNVCFIKNGSAIPRNDLDLDEVFTLFPLFYTNYKSYSFKTAFPKLMDGFDFNYRQKDRTKIFIKDLIKKALNSKKLEDSDKLVSKIDQATLKTIFLNVLSDQPYMLNYGEANFEVKQITDDFYNKILNVFKLSSADNLTKAQTLICLAAMFARLSSSRFLGQEEKSPEILREIAAGLMVKANELDATVFNDAKNPIQNHFTLWTAKMIGAMEQNGNVPFTCTAILSNTIITNIETQPQKDFKIILAGIKPAVWA